MKTGVDPVIDCVFKKVFGSEENKALCLSLINAILEDSGASKVVELELLNPYNLQEFFGDKLSVVDIRAKDQEGESFIIEVQVQMSDSYPQRLLYYWARAYQNQLQEGDKYESLSRVTIISLSKDHLPLPTRHYHSLFRVQEASSPLLLSDHCQLHTIELAKFASPEQRLESAMEKWAYFLKHGEELDEENLPDSLRGRITEKQ